MIPCLCKKKYVGETIVTVKTRVKQHQKVVFNVKYSGSELAEHGNECTGSILCGMIQKCFHMTHITLKDRYVRLQGFKNNKPTQDQDYD